MGDFVTPATPSEDPQFIYDVYRSHNLGLRIHTDTTIQAALLSQYSSHSITSTTCDLIKYAHAGHAIATLNENLHPAMRSWAFEPAARQPLDGSTAGRLLDTISFGRYDYVWQAHTFQIFVVDGQNSPGQCDRRCYLLSPPTAEGKKDQAGITAMEGLVLAASLWSEQSHDQIWVYDQGRWSKNMELWRTVQGGDWQDLIMDEDTKRAIMTDVIGFFDARETYAEFGTPWKVVYSRAWPSHFSFIY